MAGKKVIIRTLDIGADKQIGYFDLKKEENPAMGFRAIRICLKRLEIFRHSFMRFTGQAIMEILPSCSP